jgi:hypothetical protein
MKFTHRAVGPRKGTGTFVPNRIKRSRLAERVEPPPPKPLRYLLVELLDDYEYIEWLKSSSARPAR